MNQCSLLTFFSSPPASSLSSSETELQKNTGLFVVISLWRTVQVGGQGGKYSLPMAIGKRGALVSD